MAESSKTCGIEGCEKALKARELCSMHYSRLRTTGEVGPAEKQPPGMRRSEERCVVDNCARRAIARGLCGMHYSRWYSGKGLGPSEPLKAASGDGCLSKTTGYRYLGVSAGGKPRLEHRIMMEAHLGRRLTPQETVHHKNGVRHDNRLGNLELWTSSHPRGQRVSDKIVWAIELLEQYAPDKLK